MTAYRCEKEEEEEEGETKETKETKRPCLEWMTNPAARLAKREVCLGECDAKEGRELDDSLRPSQVKNGLSCTAGMLIWPSFSLRPLAQTRRGVRQGLEE